MECRACAHSYMEPDSDLICGHKEAGFFGLTIHMKPPQLAHCKNYEKFEQHLRRNPDGSLKP